MSIYTCCNISSIYQDRGWGLAACFYNFLATSPVSIPCVSKTPLEQSLNTVLHFSPMLLNLTHDFTIWHHNSMETDKVMRVAHCLSSFLPCLPVSDHIDSILETHSYHKAIFFIFFSIMNIHLFTISFLLYCLQSSF